MRFPQIFSGKGAVEGTVFMPREGAQLRWRFGQEVPVPAHDVSRLCLIPEDRAGVDRADWMGAEHEAGDVTDVVIDQHLRHAANTPSELSLMHLYPIDKAVHSVGRDETAWSARDATWSMVIAAIDPDPAKAPALRNWAKSYWESVHPHNLAGGYVNFMSDDEGESRVKASYGANFDRLVAVKRTYDPENLFRVNQNIRPST